MHTKISVIGAAIAGPAAAYALAKNGYLVTVYEQSYPSDLISAGILGIDPSVWKVMQRKGLNPDSYAIPNRYHIYGSRQTSVSPYRYIAWRDLHTMLVTAGLNAGVRYRYGKHVRTNEVAGYVIDATGVSGAARDGLPYEYTGRTIYRGRSNRPVGGSFVVFQDSVVAYTAGDTQGQANWTLYTTRPRPDHMQTVVATVPAESERLPRKLRQIVTDTPIIRSTPMSHWSERPAMHDDSWRKFTIGDVNGPIEPVTTSGASLAVLEGFDAPTLVLGTSDALDRERDDLRRRCFALQLGRELARPEIGGDHEDPRFVMHESMIYGGL